MANPQRGEVDVEINGTTYTLAMDLNALSELQEAINPRDPDSIDLETIIRQLHKVNPRYVRAFIWAMLRRHHDEVTLRGASDLVTDAGGIEVFFDQITKLLNYAKPDARDRAALKASGNGRPPEAGGAGTGTRSTSKRAKSG